MIKHDQCHYDLSFTIFQATWVSLEFWVALWCCSWNLGCMMAMIDMNPVEAWSRHLWLFGHQPHQKLCFNVLLGENCEKNWMHIWSVYESLNLLPELSRSRMSDLCKTRSKSSSSLTPSFAWHDCRKGWQSPMSSLNYVGNQRVSSFSFTLATFPTIQRQAPCALAKLQLSSLFSWVIQPPNNHPVHPIINDYPPLTHLDSNRFVREEDTHLRWSKSGRWGSRYNTPPPRLQGNGVTMIFQNWITHGWFVDEVPWGQVSVFFVVGDVCL